MYRLRLESCLLLGAALLAGCERAPTAPLRGLTANLSGGAAPVIEWTRQFGAAGFDVGRAIGLDATGLYVFGAVGGALPGQTFAGGPDDAYLRKYDLAGNELWTSQFGTSGDDFSAAGPVAIDESGVYLAGWTDGMLSGQASVGGYDVFVRKYDREGNVVWTSQFGGPGSEDYHAVAVDQTGVYAAGSVSTLPDFEGELDALVVKYDFDGNVVWTRQFGVPGQDHLEGIALKHGGIYVGGFTTGTLPGQVSAGGPDIFVRKYDTRGSEVWTRQC